ncbi:hypothetical protein [Gimesia aquarii]|uniref:Neutral/alkaline non-lysosomal ceramidase n=1 Tax=Gimesia aquarii TaxID=2527964 RepID=A0A517VNN5_9PLAN|nr:hypothetical protein [Gimesia aquarii]QDT94628.1 Neutral/alkaline non-lysosomal ceramidase [Gimesia aquarii]
MNSLLADSTNTRSIFKLAGCMLLLTVVGTLHQTTAYAGQLMAGAAKVDITNRDVKLVNDPLYVKALVIKEGDTTAVIVTVDAVAIAEIGSIRNEYLDNVRTQLEKDLKIKPANVMINASHCHGVVCADVEQRTVQAVKEAAKKLVPVNVGVGTGHEDRVMENRRLILKSGKEADVRHAYSLPPDEEVAKVGPIDPEIGILKLDKKNGETLAVVYNFACHPIQGVPNKGNTADMSGFASQVIEDNLSNGTIALFVQGCGGDINPVMYKDVDNPRDAETLGNMLGLSTLKALRKIKCTDVGDLKVINETLALPRSNNAKRIAAIKVEQEKLMKSLGGTSLNLKTFIPLVVKYNLHKDFPSYYSHRYLLEEKLGRDDLKQLDAENRTNLERYIRNIYTMEKLSISQTNLRLLNKHQARNTTAKKKTVDVEVLGIKVGDFRMITFPAELTVGIGLNIKKKSPHENTFVAGYTNGYIYYAPTAAQLKNVGGAQEDSDCMLAPEWQAIFETRAQDIIKRLK